MSVAVEKPKSFLARSWKRILLFLSVFGPATITAMSDNDASGVATYSIAGARLGYPILFALGWITILLAITQEMGMRLSVTTRKGLGDLIRERWGVKVSLLIFGALLIANMATVITDMSAIKTTSNMLGIPSIPAILVVCGFIILFVVKGKYKLTQNIMLVASLFYLVYIFSAVKASPDWGLAISNLFYPHGVETNSTYWWQYLLVGMGVLGTTITPWGQFFISSFAYDKKIDAKKLAYSQAETYIGAFLTDFFSFFMIVACTATLFVHNIPLTSGEQAALAIKPFAGDLAGTLFAVGILNAGFMGIVIVSLSTAYAFSEFFGMSGSLDTGFKESKTFYVIFIGQLVIAALVTFFPSINLFSLAITTASINAIALPLVFYYLITLTSDRELMKQNANNSFQKYFAIVCSVIIFIASVFAAVATIFRL